MIELYIENNKIDLQDNVNIAFNYSSIDTEAPSSIKNNFSTSLKIQGTKNNNIILGNIWKLDRILNEGTGVYTNFDASKRVGFKLVDNGDIVEQGYIQLTEISITGNSIEYSITLYGGLGNLFYNLMYGESEQEKTLKDVYFGWEADLETENNSVLGLWNKDYITSSWDAIENPVRSILKNDITAIPAYNGLNEDFDNNKCLVDTQNLNSSLAPYLPTSIVNDGTTYTPYNSRYALVEMPRELVEWEAKDLRSNQQRVGLKFSSFFNAISNPDYNGGYNIVLDDSFKNSVYFKNSYILLQKPNWDNFNSSSDVQYSSSALELSTSAHSDTVDVANSQGGTFEISNFTQPTIDINFKLHLVFPPYEGANIANAMYNHFYEEDEDEQYVEDYYYVYYWQGIAVRAEVYDSTNNDYLGASKTYIYTNNYSGGYSLGETKFGNGRATLFTNLAQVLTDSPDKPYNANDFVYQEFSKDLSFHTLSTYEYDANLTLSSEIPTSTNPVNIKLVAQRVFMAIEYAYANIAYPENWSYWAQKRANAEQWYYYYGTFGSTLNDTIYATTSTFNIGSGRVYDRASDSTVQEKHITKDVLFGNTKTPYKYLTDFTKMFNLKYRYNQHNNTVYIEERRKYYKDEIEELKVDLSKGIKISPTVCQSKWYKLGLETPDTYASMLYKKKNSVDYGSYRLNTAYEFNNKENNILDGNIYKNLIPYRLSSYYFKDIYTAEQNSTPVANSKIPNAILSPTYKYTLYTAGGDNYESTQAAIYGVISADYGTKYKDSSSRLCMFNAENNSMEEIDNALVFFNGWDSNEKFIVSDTLEEMMTLNNNPCYLYTVNSDIASVNVKVPLFSKTLTYDDGASSSIVLGSWDFIEPTQGFVSESAAYMQNSTIYNVYWKKYINDLYNKNTKSITVYLFLNDEPKEAMRKFYFFDNCYWVISEIKNYIVGDSKPVQAKLIKVNNINNYLT